MIWGAPNFCPKNDLMHCILPEKSIGFFAQIEVISEKQNNNKKKTKTVFTDIESVFLL